MKMMSDDILSQEEIEALLNGGISAADDQQEEKLDLTELEVDTIGEIANISFGSSATALSSLLGQKVDITTPTVTTINYSMLEEEFVMPYVAIKVEYTKGLEGMNLFVIKQSDAAIIADLMLGGDGLTPNEELSEIHLSAVQEAMNQMMGSAATSMSSVFNMKVDISPPSIDLMDVQEHQGVDNIPESEVLTKVAFQLKVGNLIDSEIMQVLPYEFSKEIVARLIGTPSEEAATMAPEMPSMVTEEQTVEAPKEQVASPISEQQATAQRVAEPQQPSTPKQKREIEVQQAQFASFDDSPTRTQEVNQNLNMLLDIPLQVTVELGRTKRSVEEILEMTPGSIIELDKLAGEPVDILVNNRLIANGEVVVIDENFGVRITDVLSTKERMNHIR